MPENNNERVARFEHAFAANDTATIDELCDSGLVDHNPAPGQEPTLDGLKGTIAAYTVVFPDMKVDLEAAIGEGDLVATRWSITGTHQAEFFGVPATGKAATVEGMNFYRLRDGRITDVWTQFDGIGLMQQLGALPSQ